MAYPARYPRLRSTSNGRGTAPGPGGGQAVCGSVAIIVSTPLGRRVVRSVGAFPETPRGRRLRAADRTLREQKRRVRLDPPSVETGAFSLPLFTSVCRCVSSCSLPSSLAGVADGNF